jgi:acyl-homoserine lactone acylase PvdQ
MTSLADYMAALAKPKPEANALSEAELKALADGLSAAMKTMRSNHNSLDAAFGDVFRVGRGDKSWPVGGGSLVEEGMATLRAIAFEPPRADYTRWGTSGQTSTQVVVLTKPIQSWTQPPIGESDRPDSSHFRDQAEKLFSRHMMKPTWYRKDELLKHVSSRIELKFVAEPVP